MNQTSSSRYAKPITQCEQVTSSRLTAPGDVGVQTSRLLPVHLSLRVGLYLRKLSAKIWIVPSIAA